MKHIKVWVGRNTYNFYILLSSGTSERHGKANDKTRPVFVLLFDVGVPPLRAKG